MLALIFASALENAKLKTHNKFPLYTVAIQSYTSVVRPA